MPLDDAKLRLLGRAQRESPGMEPEFCCWAWHADAVRLFRALRTQWDVLWRTPQGAYYCGLKYQSIPMAERGLGIACVDETFKQLQVLEGFGKAALNAIE